MLYIMHISLKDFFIAAILTVYLTPTYANESSTLSVVTLSDPWIQPCSRSSVSWDIEIVTVATTGIPTPQLNLMIRKNRELKRQVKNIRNKMILRFNDSSVTSKLQKLEVPGFPVSETSGTMNATFLYQNNFADLSKAAVYLERVYDDENQPQMKGKLDDLFFNSLSMLCELKMALHIVNGRLVNNIQRNILPENVRQTRTEYKRYVRDFVIIKKYEALLNAHQYRYLKLHKMM